MSVVEGRPEYRLVRMESADIGRSTVNEGRLRGSGFCRMGSEQGNIKSSSRILTTDNVRIVRMYTTEEDEPQEERLAS